MRLSHELIAELRVQPGDPAGLERRSTSETTTDWLGVADLAHAREVAERDLEAFKSELEASQELLYAAGSWAILIIFQALDAGGKDGTIKHVMSGINPQGCTVTSFKQPSATELAHDYLWRCVRALPEHGHIGIFNRSYYEEVLIARVHPELLDRERLPAPVHEHQIWPQRFEDINAFERHLEHNGTRIVKIFLHLSKDEQRRRFIERLENPKKFWKFSSADLAERSQFDRYLAAYEEALSATSTSHAPWYVVPADHKYAARALVAGVVAQAIDSLGLAYPDLSVAQLEALDEARATLRAE